MRILIVDDNAEVRRLIKSLLAETADDIYECDNGADAVRLYKMRLPDWVIMDVFMKEMDGIAATKEIKKIDPAAKIVIVTNHTDRRTRQAAEDVNATAFLGKDDLLSLSSLLNNELL